MRVRRSKQLCAAPRDGIRRHLRHPDFIAPDDASLSGAGCMHEGKVATRLGLTGVPRSAETIALSQALLLIQQTGVRAHISQISCARSLQLLQRAREDGIAVTADTPLANLIYTDEDVVGFNSQFNVRPVLRSEVDRQALLAAVNAGELAISSNHRPHDVAAKKATFADAQPGMSMFDGFLPMALNPSRQRRAEFSGAAHCAFGLACASAGYDAWAKSGQRVQRCALSARRSAPLSPF